MCGRASPCPPHERSCFLAFLPQTLCRTPHPARPYGAALALLPPRAAGKGPARLAAARPGAPPAAKAVRRHPHQTGHHPLHHAARPLGHLYLEGRRHRGGLHPLPAGDGGLQHAAGQRPLRGARDWQKRLYRCGRQNHRPRHGGATTHALAPAAWWWTTCRQTPPWSCQSRACCCATPRPTTPSTPGQTDKKSSPRLCRAKLRKAAKGRPSGGVRGTRPLPDASPESSRPCGAVGKKGSLPVGAAPAHRRAKREPRPVKTGGGVNLRIGSAERCQAPALPRRIAPGVLEAARLAESLKAQERGGREISLPPLSCVSSFL